MRSGRAAGWLLVVATAGLSLASAAEGFVGGRAVAVSAAPWAAVIFEKTAPTTRSAPARSSTLLTSLPLRTASSTRAARSTGQRKSASRHAPPGWLTYDDAAWGFETSPLVVSLPGSWVETKTSTGQRNVWDPRSRAESFISTLLHPGTQEAFFSHSLARVRNDYLHTDPNAVISSETVELPAGPALHITARFTDGTYALTDDDYYLLHDGFGYAVYYQGLTSKDGVDRRVFARSARTISFLTTAEQPVGT